MNFESDVYVFPVRSWFSVCAIEDQRAGRQYPSAWAKQRDIKRVFVARLCFLCIGLSYGTCVDDLNLERRFPGTLVRREIGIIGLEGYMQVAIRFELRRADGSCDLNSYRRLIRASDDLEAIGACSRSGEFVVDMLPELVLECLVILRRAVRRDSLIEARDNRSRQRRPVSEGGPFVRCNRVPAGSRPNGGRSGVPGDVSLNLLKRGF